MARYILVYEIGMAHEYEVKFEEFDLKGEQEMHSRLNKLAKEDPTLNVLCAGFMGIEFKYEPVETVVNFRPVYK